MNMPDIDFPEVFLSQAQTALRSIKHERFYENERAFQGQLLVELQKLIPLDDQTIFEQEHQKRLMSHGINNRPDIVVHEPFNRTRHNSRSDGNRAIIELKREATFLDAGKDFYNISRLIELLKYPVGIFINIASTETYAELIPVAMRRRIFSFAVLLDAGEVHIIRSPA
jgi:hypothetical protein